MKFPKFNFETVFFIFFPSIVLYCLTKASAKSFLSKLNFRFSFFLPRIPFQVNILTEVPTTNLMINAITTKITNKIIFAPQNHLIIFTSVSIANSLIHTC
uniref:Uncharacterized protein n=1 Tax=Cacopsylla melanoneura TaxID=428564 RepID=A0A8D8PQZ6_9HEMI